jgi:hypothetical protein
MTSSCLGCPAHPHQTFGYAVGTREVDLAGYRDREDFEVRLYPDIHLLSKASLRVRGPPLEHKAAQEAVRELLTTPGSKSITALRQELDERKLIHHGAEDWRISYPTTSADHSSALPVTLPGKRTLDGLPGMSAAPASGGRADSDGSLTG